MAEAEVHLENVKRIGSLCREAEASLTPDGPRRVRILLRMIVLEVDQHAKTRAGAKPVTDRRSVAPG